MNKSIDKNHYVLLLNDALTPDKWPENVPQEISLTKGQIDFEFFIEPFDDIWHQSLLEFANSNKSLPLRLLATRLFPGSHIADSNGNILFSGPDKNKFLKDKKQKELKLEKTIKKLQLIYPKIKSEYLIDFDDTVKLLKLNRDLTPSDAYDCFNDVFLAGGGSTYSDKKIASLGAYNSLLDFEALDQTLELFNYNNNLVNLSKSLKEIDYLSPIFNLILTFVDRKTDNKTKVKPK